MEQHDPIEQEEQGVVESTTEQKIATKEDFAEQIKETYSNYQHMFSLKDEPLHWGIARIDFNENGDKILQATYPVVNWNSSNMGSLAQWVRSIDETQDGDATSFPTEFEELVIPISVEELQKAAELFLPYVKEATGDQHKNVQMVKAMVKMAQSQKFAVELPNGVHSFYHLVILKGNHAPKTAQATYLKLTALSLGLAKLRSLNLDGAFGTLHNCAWIGNTPVDLEWLRDNELYLKATGQFPSIDFVDKFPRYLQHIVPEDNTRILDTSKVRFGAQIAGGTTVMNGASYINFNSGTEGACMVEGRISSSVVVGEGTDIGGGASILGVLSGGNTTPISIGKNCLLGANSTTGISLGDGCIVDGGLAILAGTKISINREEWNKIAEVNDGCYKFTEKALNTRILKGSDINGLNGIHYRQDSTTGKIVAFRSKFKVELNKDLH